MRSMGNPEAPGEGESRASREEWVALFGPGTHEKGKKISGSGNTRCGQSVSGSPRLAGFKAERTRRPRRRPIAPGVWHRGAVAVRWRASRLVAPRPDRRVSAEPGTRPGFEAGSRGALVCLLVRSRSRQLWLD